MERNEVLSKLVRTKKGNYTWKSVENVIDMLLKELKDRPTVKLRTKCHICDGRGEIHSHGAFGEPESYKCSACRGIGFL